MFMTNDDLIGKIQKSCEYLLSKKDKRNQSVGVLTCQVPWANWEKRWFSPMLAVLWESCKDESGNLIFPANYEAQVASYLEVSEDWVKAFNYYACGLDTKTIFSICLETGEASKQVLQQDFPEVNSFSISPKELGKVFQLFYPKINYSIYNRSFSNEQQKIISLDILRKFNGIT
jgi:hypothetical protein